MSHQTIPLLHAFRWRDIWLVPEWMQCVWIEGEFLRHKANFDDGSYAIFFEAVVDFIHIGEVVNRIAVFIFGVDAYLIVQNGMKANIAKIGHLLYGAQIITVTLSQRQNCAAGSEHLL